MKRLLLIAFILLCFTSTGYSATRTVDCSDDSATNTMFQSTAQSGDTVQCIASGSYTWSSSVEMLSSKYLTFDLNGATINMSTLGTFSINMHSTGINRITNGTFNRTSGGSSENYEGVVAPDAGTSGGGGIVFDNIIFNSSGGGVVMTGYGYGPVLIHSSTFNVSGVNELIHLFGPNGAASWSSEYHGGADYPNAYYFEENTVTGSAWNSDDWIQFYYGARGVARFNTISGVKVDLHGTQYSARYIEYYKNTISNNNMVCFRGGSGLVWGNTGSITGYFLQASNDGATSCGEDQPGYGPYNTVNPVYSWDTTMSLNLNVTGCAVVYDACVTNGTHVKANINTGTYANRPGTCSDNDGYWATDQGGNWDTTNGTANDGALYKCTSNTWNLYYTPLQYPHPLRAEAVPTTEFYVDNSGSPACSDQADYGTEINPWCTISYAASQVNGTNYTVYVKDGTYNADASGHGSISGISGVDSDNPITIKNYGTDQPVLRGTGYTGFNLRFISSHYIVWDGIDVTYGNYGIQIMSGSTYITIKNSDIYDIGQQAVYIYGSSSNITIGPDNVIHDTDHYTSNSEGVYIGTPNTSNDATHDITVIDNEIYGVGGEGVDVKCYTYNVTIDGNNIHDINADPTYESAGGSGIHLYEDGSPCNARGQDPNYIIRNNFIHDFTAIDNAISMRTGATVYNNVIWDGGVRAFYSDHGDSGYSRKIYHNTVDTSTMNFVGTCNDCDSQNNIGTASGTGNVAFNSGDFVSVTEGSENYALVFGASAIDQGADLTATVPTDIDGVDRTAYNEPDSGAYEYDSVNTSSTIGLTTINGETADLLQVHDTNTMTAIVGTASDPEGITASPTWACPNCTPTSGSATGTTTWTIPSSGSIVLTDSTFTSETIANWNFDTLGDPPDIDWQEWNANITAISYHGRTVLSVVDSGIYSEGYQTITGLTNGGIYRISYDVYVPGTNNEYGESSQSVSNNGSVYLDFGSSRTDTLGDVTIANEYVANTWTTIKRVFEMTGTSLVIRLHSEGDYYAYFDTIILEEITPYNVITVTVTDNQSDETDYSFGLIYGSVSDTTPSVFGLSISGGSLQ